jgi:hypothetical protein
MQDRQIIAPLESVSQKCSVCSPKMRNASNTMSPTTKNAVVLAGLGRATNEIRELNTPPAPGGAAEPVDR